MAYFLEAMLVSGSVSVWDYTTHRISMEIIIRASTEMTYEAWILILAFFSQKHPSNRHNHILSKMWLNDFRLLSTAS